MSDESRQSRQSEARSAAGRGDQPDAQRAQQLPISAPHPESAATQQAAYETSGPVVSERSSGATGEGIQAGAPAPAAEGAPAISVDEIAAPVRKLGERARDLAATAKGLAVAAHHTPAARVEGGVPGPRVITGEVVPPRRSRRGLVLGAVLLAAIGAGGYYGFDWWTNGRFIVSTDDAFISADMSMLAAKVPGLITEVDVSDNQHVASGTLLARIDDGDYKLAVEAAANHLATQDATIARIGKQIEAQNATIDQAQAQLESAKAELVRAQSAFDRAQKLAANDFGTKANLDQARADRDKALAGITAAQSALDSTKAMLDVLKAQQLEAVRSRAELATALDRARRDLSFTEIRAPFDGVVGNRAIEVGQYVQTGSRLMALVPLSTVRVDANLKETQLADVKFGQTVDVRVDAFGGRVIQGRVESVSPASGSLYSLLPPENATGNFTKIVQRLAVRIALPPEVIAEGILRPGMSVVIAINTREPGTRVIGEGIAARLAVLFGRARDAAKQMFDAVAAVEPGSSQELAQAASTER
jgi:membrane fusion protein, multidrug efflux system